MTNVPEPVDPRTLRVSDAERDRVADVLREAVSQGRISFEELDERLGLAYSARTYADLEVLTRDLPEPHAATPIPAAAAGRGPGRIGGTPSGSASLAILSGTKRAGAWVIPRTYVAVSFMGSVQLDLQHARFSEAQATIQAYALLGSIEIIAPDDIDVEVGGIPIMANFDHKASGPGLPGAPRLKVIGFALMGDVHVKRVPAAANARTELRADGGQAGLPGPV